MNKLESGMNFKNFKELCEYLGVNPKTGKQKQLQIKKFKESFDWINNGHKITITKTYEKPKTKIATKKPNHNIIIESLLLNLLATSDNGDLIVSNSYLYSMLKMINDNYILSKRAPHLLANYLDIDVENVNEFFDRAHATIERNLEKTLKSLYSRSLIDYGTTRMVCVASAHAKFNDDGKLSVDITDYTDDYGVNCYAMSIETPRVLNNYRKATDEENLYIMGVEYEVMSEIGIRNQQDLIRYGRWHDWQREVNRRIRNERNIVFYYQGYEIYSNLDHVERELKKLEKEQAELLGVELNSQIQNQIMNNTFKRHKRANESLLLDNKTVRRQKVDYLESHLKIANTVINISTQNKIGEMKDGHRE